MSRPANSSLPAEAQPPLDTGGSQTGAEPEPELTPEQALERRRRVKAKTEAAIEYLAACDLAACAAILRVGQIEVIDDPEQCQRYPTAALIKEGHFTSRMRIVINAAFCDRSQRDVTAILLHELLHHIMRHLDGISVEAEEEIGGEKMSVQQQGLANVVFDAFINYTIAAMNPSLAGFMRDFYPEDQAPLLFLRSRSKPQGSDEEVYRALYEGRITEQELYQYLRDQGHGSDLSGAEVVLLGDHSGGGPQGNAVDPSEVPGVVREMGEALRQGSQRGGQMAGRLDQLLRDFIRVQKLGKAAGMEDVFRMNLIEACRAQVVQSVLGDLKDQPLRRVIMPAEGPSRSDMFKIMAGVEPMLWDNFDLQRRHGAVRVYLDVSGSMAGEVEFVYGCCVAFEEYLDTKIFLFSNQIDAISLEELRAGKISSTYGTDFDCVVEHFLEGEADRCILFTDGHARLDGALAQRLEESGRLVVGVVTQRGSDSVLSDFCSSVHRMPTHG